MNKKPLFWTGIAILIVMVLTFFIKIEIDSGANYVTFTPLLGIIIFHNPFILGLYILIALVLIVRGRK